MELLSYEDVKLIEPFYWILSDREANQYIYSKWYYDIEWFTDFHLSHYKRDKKTKWMIETPLFHKEIWSSIWHKDSLIIIARDHWKTTSEFFYIIWNVCYQVDPAILLIMPDWLWKETLWKVRDEFEFNKSLLTTFWRLVPTRTKAEQSKRWSSKQLEFLNHTVLEAVSMWGSIRWKRPTLIMVDDPQENKDVQNPQITDKFNNWFFTSVYNTLDDSGRCIVLWTIIGDLCFVNYLKNAWKDFNVIEYSAIQDMVIKKLEKDKLYMLHWKPFVWDWKNHIVWGKPLWKAKWSLPALDRRYQKLQEKNWDDDKFMQEYMNIPLILNGKPFYPKDLLRLHTLTQPIKIDTVFEDLILYWATEENCLIWVDVSEWLLSWDYSTVRVRSRKTLNILASYRGHIDPDELPRVINRLFELWFTWRIAIEKNNHWLTTIKSALLYPWSWCLFKERPIDKITNRARDSYGWHTNLKTRPYMLDEHKRMFRDWHIDIDKPLKDEMEVFFRKENWSPEALAWKHDDLVMWDAICLQMVDYPLIKNVIV